MGRVGLIPLILLSISLFSVKNYVNPARILGFFPVPFHSHQSVFRVIIEELSRQGHQLVVLAPDPQNKPIPNVTQIDVLDISFKLWDEKFERFKSSNSFTINPLDFWRHMGHPLAYALVDAQLSTPEMQAIIQDPKEKFDVILVESVIPTSVVIGARFKAPIIQISSFFGLDDNFLDIGTPVHPILLPDFNFEKTWNLSFWERLSSVYTFIRLRLLSRDAYDLENKLVRKHFGENAPTIQELRKNIQMLLLNLHPIWDNNRPVPPSVVYMGALHLKKPKPIPEYLQNYLDACKNGVIYLSLGSKLKFSDLPPTTMQIFLDVFESLPYDVLIKWDGGELPDKPDNVRLEKWLPQNDMLHNPKIKAFLMQGGLQSTDEAIAAKVPMIAFPVMGDQNYNAQKFLQLGIGEQLDINNINKDVLRQKIIAVVENESYRKNITQLSRIMEEQRAGGLQKAVYWIEYVAKHGALHLRSPFADTTLTDVFMLDIIGALALVLSLIIIAIIFLFICIKNSFKKQRKLKSS